MSEATADSARTSAATRVTVGIIVYSATKSDETQMLVHQLQVKRYPKRVDSGGYRFQMRLRVGSVMVSVVTRRVAR